MIDGIAQKNLPLPGGDSWRRLLVHKMFSDPVLWIETCLKIRSKEGALVPFKLNVFQRRLINAIMDSLKSCGRAFFVILKGRQLGISSACRGLMLWQAIHREGQQCVIAAHEVGLVRQNMLVMREMLENRNTIFGYPKPTVCCDTRILWRKTGSSITPRLPAGKSEGRGMALNFLHCTEADYFDTLVAGCWERFLGGVLPALPRKGAIFIVESTCQGRKALYDLYVNSLQPNSPWQHLFFPWYEEPNYGTDLRYDLTDQELGFQEKYRLSDDQIHFWAGFARQCGTLMALREYPFCIKDAFAVSGSKGLITADIVERAMGRQPWPLQDREPVILGIDPSRLRDATGIAIRQGKNMIEVCEIPPLGDVYALATVVSGYLRDYKINVINCDCGGLGGPFIDVLQKTARRFVNPVDFNGKATEGDKYFNRRAEMYDNLRKWLVAEGRLPANSRLANELLAIDINDRKEGRLLLEPKHKLSKSPNMADACALTMTAENYFSQHMVGHAIGIKSWN